MKIAKTQKELKYFEEKPELLRKVIGADTWKEYKKQLDHWLGKGWQKRFPHMKTLPAEVSKTKFSMILFKEDPKHYRVAGKLMDR